MSDSKIRNQNDPIETGFAREVHPAEKFALLQAQTRRHFLRNFTAGVGTMFLGTLASQFGPQANASTLGVDGTPRLDFTRDPSQSTLSAASPVCCSGQAHHLSAHGGCAQPIGAF